MGELQSNKNSKSERVMSQIRQLSHNLGVRQKDLAATLGLKPSQMNLYMQGKVDMRADRMMNVLEVLGIDIEEILSTKLANSNNTPGIAPTETVLAKIGRLDDCKRESIFKIIKVLGSK